MLIIFTLLFLTAYLGIGTMYSRGRYANILAAANHKQSDIAAVNRSKERMRELDKHYDSMRSTNSRVLSAYHSRNCDKYMYTHIGHCNCGAQKKNRAEYTTHRDFVEGKIDEPEVAKPMLLWPGYILTDFIKSGEPTDKELAGKIKELERAKHDAELAELRAREAKALDEELALARKR